MADVNGTHRHLSILLTSAPESELVIEANKHNSTTANEAASPGDESISKSLSQMRELISKFKEFFEEPSTTKSKSKSTPNH